MKQEIVGFINLHNRFKDLGVDSEKEFYILPENIEIATSTDKFIFSDTAITVQKIFKSNDVPIESLLDEHSSFRQRRSIDWFAPILFVSYSMLTENSTLISVSLNVLSNYITDFFKGSFGEKKVKIEIVVETTPKKTYKCINYEGDIEGLKGLSEVIKCLK